MCHCPQVRLSTLPPEPVIPSKKPFKVDLVGGKRYAWCTCGHSKKQVDLGVWVLQTRVQKEARPGDRFQDIYRYLFSHLYLSAFLWWSPQNQSRWPVPATLRPRERLHRFSVRLQIHWQPTVLWRHAQAGLYRICSTARTNRRLSKDLTVHMDAEYNDLIR